MNRLARMAVVDRFIDVRVLGLSWWLAPARKEEIYDWLVSRGFNIQTVVSRMKRLEGAGLILTTVNYCLPRNRMICQTAGDRMQNEIIAELNSEETKI